MAEKGLSTMTDPFPPAYPPPAGFPPTGIVATTVPPPESTVRAEAAKPSVDWFSPIFAPPELISRGPAHANDERTTSTNSPATATIRGNDDLIVATPRAPPGRNMSHGRYIGFGREGFELPASAQNYARFPSTDDSKGIARQALRAKLFWIENQRSKSCIHPRRACRPKIESAFRGRAAASGP